MLMNIALVQAVVLSFFFLLEKTLPARQHNKKPYFHSWFTVVCLFGLIWLKVVLVIWLSLPFAGVLPINGLDAVAQGFIFYFFYSLGNYWFHRWKHANVFLWHYLHSFHHAPTHMETVIAFFRHPYEIIANTIYLILIGKILLGASPEAVAIALAIEGSLECFHHSNINIPKRLRWVGHIIQTPEMHIVHHERGVHKYNYGPFLWDWVFGTLSIPVDTNKPLGLKGAFSVIFLQRNV